MSLRSSQNEATATAIARAVAERLANTLRMIIVVLATAMLAVLTFQVFMRFVVGQALSWSEEFALTCFTWSMLLAMALGVRELIHVRMDILVDKLPRFLQRWIERLCALLITLFGLFLAWSGYNYTLDSVGTTSAAIAFPMVYLYAATSACGLFTFLFGLETLLFGPAKPVTARSKEEV
ncbi:MAG: TRAP transporter small permease [Porticoccaceae bacterium]|jgi:TRAP-type C4-dicarboxylate transport system permease small subunit